MSFEEVFMKLWPGDVPRNMDIPEIPIDQMLRNAAHKFPDSVAISYFGVQLTYRKLDELVDRAAAALHNLGLKKGETVALHFTNVPPCIVCYYAVIRAGGKVTLLSPLFKKLEIEYQLRDSEATIFIMWDAFDQIAEGAIPENVKTVVQSSLTPWFSNEPEKEDLVSPDGKFLYLEDLIHTTEPNPPKVDMDPTDTANLQYTGGTTGLPKGAMLTHYNLVANAYQCRAWFPEAVEGGEIILVALPLYHIYAQTVCMNFGILIGANLVMVSNPRDTDELLETIVHNKITIFPGVSALYNNLNNYPGIEDHDMSSIKFCLCGAGALPAEVQDKFEKLTGAVLREGYGLTEASPVTHAVPLSRFGKPKAGTVGFPFPNTQCKIVDLETGERLLGIGEEGEICVKGPQVMKGYYKKTKETAACLRNGWLYTGDVGVVDEEGYLSIKSRIKNLIKYKGHSVYPAEIEAYMYEHPAILDCAVIGIPDPEVGENLKAYVVLKDEYKGKVTEQQIIDWMKDRVAAYKYPRSIQFIQEMPKSAVGKVLHRLLREGKTDIND
ncbi:MAG: long-chain fatty acid--CoA ligase [Candidatus Lokiarchaeota archaeon]|nr:long-chain fatty acid--CoA ligase [Candidatus Lokiarchaeota archaeon]